MDVAAIAAGIETRLATISGLRTYDTIPEDIVVPAAVVVPGDPFITYHSSMGAGVAEIHWRVTLLVSRSSARSGWATMYDYLSSGTGETSSVLDAIEAENTLGGAVDQAIVQAAGDVGTADVAGTSYLKADLSVYCLARRT